MKYVYRNPYNLSGGDAWDKGSRVELSHGFYAVVRLQYDEDTREPWKEYDGNIVGIRTAKTNYTGHISKSPGERILHKGDRNQWDYVYDFNESVKVALRDGWGVESSEGLTKKQIAVKAVEHNADWIRRWLDNDWCWVTLQVTLFDSKGDEIAEDYLSGIESDSDYWKECASDIIDGMVETEITSRRDQWLQALREAREVRYWATRDVVTV